MHHVTIIGDSRADPKALRKQLAGIFDIDFAPLEQALRLDPGISAVFDIDLSKNTSLLSLKEWLKRKPADAKAIFLTEKSSHLQNTRAYALGATDILNRPINGRELLAKLWSDTTSLSVASLASDPKDTEICKSPAVSAAVNTLQNIFSSACVGEPVSCPSIKSAGNEIVGHIETQGLIVWIDTVRTHHSITYQHSLLVTGLAVAFGQQIGVSRADRQRLSFAGMLHDIGKARIPLTILEKPGRLDDNEMAVMKKHPLFGFDALGTAAGLPVEMLDMVVHHHEYLDGSGYPHGLGAGEICDLVRMMTIADIFGALIERRSYKPPLSGSAAYQILLDNGPKLDKDLVRAFRPVPNLGSVSRQPRSAIRSRSLRLFGAQERFGARAYRNYTQAIDSKKRRAASVSELALQFVRPRHQTDGNLFQAVRSRDVRASARQARAGLCDLAQVFNRFQHQSSRLVSEVVVAVRLR